MASSLPSKQCFVLKPENDFKVKEEEEEKENSYDKTYKEYNDTIPTLPKGKGWMTDYLVQYKEVWLGLVGLKGVMLLQQHFKALPSDIFLATFQKSGTTWFKALIFAIMNRNHYDFSTHPLLNTSPHDCIPFIETIIDQQQRISILNLASSRLLSTHIPYALLPNSIKLASGCRIVYVCREPKDVLVSKWQFLRKLRPKELPPLSLEEAFDMFCDGVSHYGPYWDHVLGYWNVGLQNPDKVLFLYYEDMRKMPEVFVKRLAEFVGHPFSLEEEKGGVVHEIIKLCSFENLSNLEVNKTGVLQFGNQFSIENHNYFRKAQIGDWKNYLTATMAKHLDGITVQRFHGSGLMYPI